MQPYCLKMQHTRLLSVFDKVPESTDSPLPVYHRAGQIQPYTLKRSLSLLAKHVLVFYLSWHSHKFLERSFPFPSDPDDRKGQRARAGHLRTSHSSDPPGNGSKVRLQGGAHHPHGASASVEAVLGGVGVEGAGPPAHRADAPGFLLQGASSVDVKSVLCASSVATTLCSNDESGGVLGLASRDAKSRYATRLRAVRGVVLGVPLIPELCWVIATSGLAQLP